MMELPQSKIGTIGSVSKLPPRAVGSQGLERRVIGHQKAPHAARVDKAGDFGFANLEVQMRTTVFISNRHFTSQLFFSWQRLTEHKLEALKVDRNDPVVEIVHPQDAVDSQFCQFLQI